MTYEIESSTRFLLEVVRVPQRVQKSFFKDAHPYIQRYAETQTSDGKIKKLRGYKYLWRYKLGRDYRVAYRVKGKNVTFLKIGHRKITQKYSKMF